MQFVDMKCPACGGIISNKITSRIVTCEYCGSRFALDGDEADAFLESDEEEYDEEYEDYEGSDLTMEEFAEAMCADFLDNFGDGSFKSSNKILRGLGIGDDDVYLIHDDTMLHSGKNGFAITDMGLYCRELGEEAQFIDWETFARLNDPNIDGGYVKCGGRSVCYFTDDDDLMPELLSLYEYLQMHAQNVF